MKSAAQWLVDKLIDYNYSQDTGMINIKIPSWEFLEIKHQAQEIENQFNKNQFGKGQEWEHKNMITSDDTQVSKTFLEAQPPLPQQEISDEEIQAEAIKRSSKYQDSTLFENTWEEAIEWYKEKLQSLK
jgi:hypothetical protein